MKKGLRQPGYVADVQKKIHQVRIAALMKKGLRPRRNRQPDGQAGVRVRIAALMKKGLRPGFEVTPRRLLEGRPNCCPDEEGIKTFPVLPCHRRTRQPVSELLP